MQQPSPRGPRPHPAAAPATDGVRGPHRGTNQPWHALASTLLDVAAAGSGHGVSGAVVARAAQGTGLSPATIRSMMSAARYVRATGHEGPVLASVESVLALRRLSSSDPCHAARLLGAVMAGQATSGDLLPDRPKPANRKRGPKPARHAEAPPALPTLRAPPGMALH